MALTKTELTERLAERTMLDNKAAHEALENILEIMKVTLESGEDVMISGFGKFCVNEKKARKGRNPATGSSMTLPKRRVVTFKCAGKLRDRINGAEQC
ncbi:integration host factor subunit alpha [Desulfobacula toluolica]|uniref:Integration host factor subunit alpha n=1 Tax=Desulfobacula toluolica (strain DSM 7467 / Tol2) TaxID=651182 RepID=K0NLH1_DESTT|nr:integration host factor subunit alpha [Desulfobacula toluolica]CCK82421.1 IhfA: integration host factor, alpha subunit [Desulfobacula toluolica Tol2]